MSVLQCEPVIAQEDEQLAVQNVEKALRKYNLGKEGPCVQGYIFEKGRFFMADYLPQRQLMSIEEWRALECEGKGKHEYIDTGAYLLSGSDPVHDAVCRQVIKVLGTALANSTYKVYNSDHVVCLSPTRYVYPDVTITAEQVASEQGEIQAPHLIVEVLSEPTVPYNQDEKFRQYYVNCQSLQEYVLVALAYQAVEAFRRVPDELWKAYRKLHHMSNENIKWTSYRFATPGQEIELASIGITIPVSAFYEGTTVPNLMDENPDGNFA